KEFNNFKCSFIKIPDIKDIFEGCNDWRGFFGIWARFLFPELKREINKAIYLDVDICLYDDISKLYYEDLNNCCIGACSDIGIKKFGNRGLPISKEHVYMNSGVILIDCEKWREEKITQKIIDIGKKYGNKLRFPDQDALNIVFNNNNYKLLPQRYNFMDIDTTCKLNEEWTSCIIRHYVQKPWKCLYNKSNKGKEIKMFEEFWFYAGKTSFFNGLKIKFLKNNISNKSYLLFNLIPIIKIKTNNNVKKYLLFGIIPLMKVKE
ncbi:MAG: hypothetical protein LBC92_02005, partial [Rickettsiales bacterium]|nr:hypothetical protein [Rickettsiales bacterium]